ncbi:MAG TPA: HD domain-containing protein [Allosphingosinicella sp.]|nr:HD domain-containing protein [Allosphingosinicella sp.]
MADTESRYSYQAPIGLKDLARIDPMFARLAETPAFARLKDIRFLGGIDFLLVPNPNGSETNKRYTRYQHSLGVAGLALLYCHLRQVPNEARKLAYAAALLHDVGHGPLSHSLEPVFEEAFGIGHHKATEDIILGRVPLGRELSAALKESGADAGDVIAVLEGKYDPFEGFFSGPINFDTIEGILRSRRYATRTTIPISPVKVVQSATMRADESDRAVVDSFWGYKDEVYRLVVRAPTGVLADYVCQEIARANLSKLNKEDFFSTETSLFRKLPTLRPLLLDRGRLAALAEEVSIRYKVREFTVSPDGDFFTREDKARYVQRKWDSVLTFPQGRDSTPLGERTLFDDPGGVPESEEFL